MKLTPQAQTVLNHLRMHDYLTSWQAEGVYRIRRLASRIDELAAAGFEIAKEPMRDATGQRYTRYFLSKRQRESGGSPVLPARPTPRKRLDGKFLRAKTVLDVLRAYGLSEDRAMSAYLDMLLVEVDR